MSFVNVQEKSEFLYWDTAAFSTRNPKWDGRGPEYVSNCVNEQRLFIANAGTALSNMLMSGQLGGDTVAVVKKLLFGIRKDHVATWAECHAALIIECKEYFRRPLWYPADVVHSSDHKAFTDLEDPMDWVFMEWGLEVPLKIASRQAFEVRVFRYGNPRGMMRVAMQGVQVQDAM